MQSLLNSGIVQSLAVITRRWKPALILEKVMSDQGHEYVPSDVDVAFERKISTSKIGRFSAFRRFASFRSGEGGLSAPRSPLFLQLD